MNYKYNGKIHNSYDKEQLIQFVLEVRSYTSVGE